MTKFTKSAIVFASAVIASQASAALACGNAHWKDPLVVTIIQDNHWDVTCSLRKKFTGSPRPGEFVGECDANDGRGGHLATVRLNGADGTLDGRHFQLSARWTSGPTGEYSADVDNSGFFHNRKTRDNTGSDDVPWHGGPTGLACD